MRFERLRLHGFKSFVDPTELLIGPGLTGVVGPNGCGKSNLLEALRWVMGEASARSLRGGAMDDVIFAGTASRPQRGAAEVGLFGRRHDGSDLEVVRRIERGAGSAYRIDGRDARARDVALLFADASTGAHSPALVSQGRIGAIIAARPAERRLMLEEAAGIAGLHVRRRDAEARLRATEANLEQVGQAVEQMEARAQALVRQARAAERYRAIGARIRVAEARLLHARWRDAAAAEASARSDVETAGRDVERIGVEVRGATDALASAAARVEASRAEAEAARAQLSTLLHEAERLAGRKGEAERRLAELARARDGLAKDRGREGRLAHDAADAIRRLAEEDADLSARIAAAETEAAPTAERRRIAAEQAAAADVALARAQAAHATRQADRRVAETGLTNARRRADAARAELARAASARVPVDGSDDLASALSRSRQEEADAAAALDLALASGETTEAERASLVAARDAAGNAVAAAAAALTALRTELAAIDGAPSGGASVERLADLLRAPPGLEQALAAALGSDVDLPIAAWRGAAPLPGAAPAGPTMETLVQAPPELGPRLGQIWLVEDDDGSALPVGMSVVTRAGRVRRWDGLVLEDVGAEAAARLVRENRRDALRQELPVREGAAERARQAAADVDAKLTLLNAHADRIRAATAHAETRGRTARREIDRLEGLIERAARQAADADARHQRASAEAKAAADELGAAEQSLHALPDGSAEDSSLAALVAAAGAARADAARLDAEAGTSARAVAAMRERAAAVERELGGWRVRADDASRRLGEMTDRDAAIAEEMARLVDLPAAIAADEAAVSRNRPAAEARARSAAEDARAAEADQRRREADAAALGEALATAREARAGAAARLDAAALRRVETGRIAGERFSCPAPTLPERMGFNPSDVGDASAESAAHDRLLAERERMGPVNLVAEAELAELRNAADAQAAEREELVSAVAALRGSIAGLNREGRQRLLAAFDAVDGHFRRLFGTLFQGGEAHLTLIEADDPLEAGLEIMAQPPGKRLQSLSLLSGGEQALTAVALIFALFLTAPAPVCVLDEVDAPLDDANIERFCDLLDLMARDTETRYLVVTHNAVTMSRMHRLFGVTMVERGISRLVSVDLGGAEALMAAE